MSAMTVAAGGLDSLHALRTAIGVDAAVVLLGADARHSRVAARTWPARRRPDGRLGRLNCADRLDVPDRRAAGSRWPCRSAPRPTGCRTRHAQHLPRRHGHDRAPSPPLVERLEAIRRSLRRLAPEGSGIHARAHGRLPAERGLPLRRRLSRRSYAVWWPPLSQPGQRDVLSQRAAAIEGELPAALIGLERTRQPVTTSVEPLAK
jgi:hypothetical protein